MFMSKIESTQSVIILIILISQSISESNDQSLIKRSTNKLVNLPNRHSANKSSNRTHIHPSCFEWLNQSINQEKTSN